EAPVGSRGDPAGMEKPTGSTRLRVESIVKKVHVRELAKGGPFDPGGVGGWGFAKIQGPRALCTERAQHTPTSRRGSLKARVSISDGAWGRPGWWKVREPSRPACAWW